MVRAVPTLLMLLGLLAASARADGDPVGAEPTVAVPDVRGLDGAAAVRVLIEAGLAPGRLFDRRAGAGQPLGSVLQQAPPPDREDRSSRRPPGTPVHLRLAAAEDGDPKGRVVPSAWVLPPARVEVIQAAPARPPPAASLDDLPAVEDVPQAAVGSPDGAAVPALEGLLLVEAQQLGSARGFGLDVERVPGHPVGRVLAQDPPAGAPWSSTGRVRLRVAAGGDRPAATAPEPSLAITRLAVPDLLDRTWPQAERILAEMGFEARREEATHGPPDRVADQVPPAGTPLERGGVVLVHVAPSRPRSAPAAAPVTAPAAAPATAPATAPAAAPAGRPRPIAPGPGARLGDAATLVVGFSWHPVAGVEAYLLEVEEASVDGWFPLLRQVVRRPAALVDLERLGTPPGVVRWRVRAVEGGRSGSSSDWVEVR